MIEPLRDPLHNRSLQRVVVQHIRINEGRDLRLAARDFLRLAADAGPHRIDSVENRTGLVLGHASVSDSFRGSAAKCALLSQARPWHDAGRAGAITS